MKNKTKYEIVTVNHVEITVDVSLLLKSEELYFNATDIAKQFGKKPDDFLRLQATKEYIEEVLLDSQVGISRLENLVRVTHGGKYKGTWLHQELAFEFAGWCSAKFRRSLHKWAENRLHEEHRRKLLRLELKTGFLPLTQALLIIHPEPKPYHFSNECNMINRLVTGMDAKRFKELNGVSHVRDGLDADGLRKMDALQKHDATLIDMGFSYDERKELLTRYSERQLVV